ncbi:MAG: LemA family protein [Epsilonproteobacteria bacterium]|nr:LemA family protein [Campylobacterota bacterium]
MSFGSILLVIIIATTLYLIVIYNRFISLRTGIDASWSDIDVQLKRRYNLIPSLIETVKGYAKHERETFDAVVEARNSGMSASSVEEQGAAENVLTASLGKLFALAESYPELKANTTFLNLQAELANMEEAIQNARRYYNAIVRDYNAKVDSFPDLIIARKFNFTPREYFELEDIVQKEMPKVEF